jgi:hypothetical protein
MLIQSLLTYFDRVYLLEEAKSPSIKYALIVHEWYL